ncbi:hypothetical protein ACJX0J_005697 [Zea mays]
MGLEGIELEVGTTTSKSDAWALCGIKTTEFGDSQIDGTNGIPHDEPVLGDPPFYPQEVRFFHHDLIISKKYFQLAIKPLALASDVAILLLLKQYYRSMLELTTCNVIMVTTLIKSNATGKQKKLMLEVLCLLCLFASIVLHIGMTNFIHIHDILRLVRIALSYIKTIMHKINVLYIEVGDMSNIKKYYTICYN